jgi:ParB/RepB/Spo0J family partition protein
MNAPTTNLEPQPTYFPREKLVPSPTNPRKRKGLDIASLTELAKTMRPPIGILQPILARWVTKIIDGVEVQMLEIIAGERRWRASEITPLSEVPVIVRQLSDLEVLQIQLIENKQREDLDELEEAEGYEKLMQQLDADGEPYTATTIADAMGVSRSTIYARLKLLKLCQDGRQAFYDGKLDASRALLIARMPVEKIQLQVLKKAIEVNEYYGQPQLSYRQLRDLIQSEYMLFLEDAPFDINDANLLPKVGNCTNCQNRTGNQPDIFEDVDCADVCTDPVCHAMKKTAHVLALQKKYEEDGCKLLVGKEAKKIIPKNYMQSTEDCLKDHGLVKLDAKVPGDDQHRTWHQLLKEKKIIDIKGADKPAVSKTVIENPRNTSEMIETVSIEAATKALREAGFEITLKGNSKQADTDKHAKEREKEKQELAIENTFRSRLFDTLHTRIEADMLDPNSKTFPTLYLMLAKELWNDYDNCAVEDITTLMRKYTTLPDEQEGEEIDWRSHIAEFGNNIPNLTPAQHLMLIIELPLIVAEITTSHHGDGPRTMLKLAEELDIDASAMRKKAAAEHKVAAAAKKTEKAKPEKKAKPESVFAADQKVRTAATWPFPTPI